MNDRQTMDYSVFPAHVHALYRYACKNGYDIRSFGHSVWIYEDAADMIPMFWMYAWISSGRRHVRIIRKDEVITRKAADTLLRSHR